jgi:hypothetical protein
MVRQRVVPTEEEVKKTYWILKGMVLRKAFLTVQDREDFIQNVMMSAFRSYNGGLERSLSFKNLACGPAFKRAYCTYWAKQYGNRPIQERRGDETSVADLPPTSSNSEKIEGHLANRMNRLDTIQWENVRDGDQEARNDSLRYNEGREIETIRDESHADPVDLNLVEVVRAEIEGLAAPYSELLWCFLMGMTREEVARSTKKSTSWAKKYTLIALEKLVKGLKARGIEVEAAKLADL